MKYTFENSKKIKFFLVFFCALILINCGDTDDIKAFKIYYKNEKANSISFTSNDNPSDYSVFVKGENTTPVLGSFRQTDDKIVFEPAIPFSNGQSYEIKKDSKIIFDFTIAQKITKAPELVAIYPSTDTVPENLLKMYFVFSRPMQEVESMLDYIKVFNKTDRREEEIFLELENELWNAEHTQLTLWLDPGRIKRDLIPNKEKGLPIEAGKKYELTVSTNLKDADGIPLTKSYYKTLYVVGRDTQSPNIKDWEIHEAKAGTEEALTIDFNEPLDAVLATESFQIDTRGEPIQGTFKLNHEEQQLVFYPDTAWAKGDYKITVISILEDLAGNNLNRLFDENLSLKKADSPADKTHVLSFAID